MVYLKNCLKNYIIFKIPYTEFINISIEKERKVSYNAISVSEFAKNAGARYFVSKENISFSYRAEINENFRVSYPRVHKQLHTFPAEHSNELLNLFISPGKTTAK